MFIYVYIKDIIKDKSMFVYNNFYYAKINDLKV